MPSNFFTYSPTTGTGNTIINVSANTQNTGTADNLAAITISNTANSATVELKQLYRPTFSQFASATFPTTGGDIYFTIHSEYDVVFRSVPSWITISYNGRQYSEGERISSGVVDNKTFTLTAEANTGQPRTVNNTMNMGHYIGDTLQNYYTYFSFQQNGVVAPASITLSPTYIEVGSAATSTTVNMTVENCTFDHFTTSSSGTFTIVASNPVNNTITLTFPASTTTGETRGYLSFYLYDTDGNTYAATITVVRAGKVQTKDMTLSPTGATVVSSRTSYTIYVPTTSCTFCGMTYTNSNQNFPVTAVKDGSYIRLTYSANTGDSRTTLINFTLRDENNNPYYKTFSLVQEAATESIEIEWDFKAQGFTDPNRMGITIVCETGTIAHEELEVTASTQNDAYTTGVFDAITRAGEMITISLNLGSSDTTPIKAYIDYNNYTESAEDTISAGGYVELETQYVPGAMINFRVEP